MAAKIILQARGQDPAYNRSHAVMMAGTGKPLLFVEDDPDKEIIMMLFDYFRKDQILYGNGKEGVKALVKKAIEDNRRRDLYRGLVDRDIETFRSFGPPYAYEDCIFYTDERDMETLLWSTDKDLFRNLLITGITDYNVDRYAIAEKHEMMFEKITQAAYKLGIIRLIVECPKYYNLGIKVNPAQDERGRPIKGAPTPYDREYYNFEKMEMDIPRLIDNYLCVNQQSIAAKYDIESAYDDLIGKYSDRKWKIIRGHDLDNMIMKTVNQWRAPIGKQWTINEFEKELHKLYKGLIHQTEVGKSIENWIRTLIPATA